MTVTKSSKGFVIGFDSNVQGEWFGRKVLVRSDAQSLDEKDWDTIRWGLKCLENNVPVPHCFRVIRKGFKVQ